MPGLPRGAGRRPGSQTKPSSRCASTSTTGAGPACPFYLRTGKRLPQRITEVASSFSARRSCRSSPGSDPEPDALPLRVAPSEGLSIRFGAKVPGRSFDVRQASMDFTYAEGFPHGSADAYERVISWMR